MKFNYVSEVRPMSIASGIISTLPGGNKCLFNRYRRTAPDSGTFNARYCYSVWLRHLVLVNENGLLTGVPDTIAELGPGNSLGTGLAALLSGVNRYYSFDLIRHAKNDDNLRVFEELVELFRKREAIPDSTEFPAIQTKLESYKFPGHILTGDMLSKSLSENRVQSIKNELLEYNATHESFLRYAVPWNDHGQICENSVDMIFSMSVLEHIDDLEGTYRAFRRWLKDDGFMSHEIDFTSHGHTKNWNGHWTIPAWVWRILRGGRPYMINRQPHSTHIRLNSNNGFEVVRADRKFNKSRIASQDLAREYRNLSEVDMNTYNSFILSKKQMGFVE